MGVLTDYFRAPDRATVERAMADSTFSPVNRDPAFDGVELKGIDEKVLLGQLIAAIRGVEWTTEVVSSVVLYPPADTAPTDQASWNDLDEDSAWASGPWVTELDAHTVETLASLEADRVSSVAAEWATAEEFSGHLDPEGAASIVTELRALARRAEQAGELLYCWVCL